MSKCFFSPTPKPFNKSSPLGQIKLGISVDLVQCKEGQELVIKTSNLFPACIKSNNVEKLRSSGWAISEERQNEMFDEFTDK